MRKVSDISMQDLAKEIGKTISKENREAFRAAVRAGCWRSIPHLVQTSPVDTGLYAQSWSVDEDPSAINIGNFAPYAPMIEFGTQKYTPPIGPLLAWAKRVLGDASQPPNYSSEVWAFAKGVQKAFQDRGMIPQRVLTNAMPTILKNIKEEVSKL